MAKFREVFKTEKYMDDAAETILSNFLKGVKRRKQLSIWDPITEPSVEIESCDSNPSERSQILTKILDEKQNSFPLNIKRSREEHRFCIRTAVKRNDITDRRLPKSFNPHELRSDQNNKEEIRVENSMPPEYNLESQYSKNEASESSRLIEQINYQHEQEQTPNNSFANSNVDVKNSEPETLEPSTCPLKEQENPQIDEILLKQSILDTNFDVQSMGSKTIDDVNQTDQKSNFTAWCEKRLEEFNVKSRNYQLSQYETKTVTFESEEKKREEKNPNAAMKNKKTDHAKKYSKSKSVVDVSVIEHKKSKHAKNYSKSKSEVDISDIEKIKTSHAKKCSKSKREDNLTKTQVCIKLANEYDKSYELAVDVVEISRIKKKFPKLNDILPDIDTSTITLPCCFEAVTIILKYLFHVGWHNKLPNATIAVEVLAASKNWEIPKFYSMFYDIFIQQILPSSNIRFIFSQASHYNLHDVCSACQEINGASFESSTYKRKQKTCSISITTYIEPLELCIPLNALEHSDIDLSFERHISNMIRIQALSGFITIIGFQINLNIDQVERCDSNSLLNIDYNAKNLTLELEHETGSLEKPLRPMNAIHFKNPLKVNSKQLVEITVETDLKPLLCSTYPTDVKIIKRKREAKFSLNVASNYKIPKSNENVFIVGTLLYYVNQ